CWATRLGLPGPPRGRSCRHRMKAAERTTPNGRRRAGPGPGRRQELGSPVSPGPWSILRHGPSGAARAQSHPIRVTRHPRTPPVDAEGLRQQASTAPPERTENDAVRLALIDPPAPRTTLDGAWWPRTSNLTNGLPSLL